MYKVLFVNVITAARLIGTIVLFLDVRDGFDYTRETGIWFMLGLSDILDGFLARKLGATTKFGAAFDATTDKFVVATMLVALYSYRAVPLWLGAYLVPMLVIWAWQYYAYTRETGSPPKPRKLARACNAVAFFSTVPFFMGHPDIGEYILAVPILLNIGVFFDYRRAYGFRWWLFPPHPKEAIR